VDHERPAERSVAGAAHEQAEVAHPAEQVALEPEAGGGPQLLLDHVAAADARGHDVEVARQRPAEVGLAERQPGVSRQLGKKVRSLAEQRPKGPAERAWQERIDLHPLVVRGDRCRVGVREQPPENSELAAGERAGELRGVDEDRREAVVRGVVEGVLERVLAVESLPLRGVDGGLEAVLVAHDQEAVERPRGAAVVEAAVALAVVLELPALLVGGLLHRVDGGLLVIGLNERRRGPDVATTEPGGEEGDPVTQPRLHVPLVGELGVRLPERPREEPLDAIPRRAGARELAH